MEALGDTASSEVERAIAVTETDLVRALEQAGERADLLSMFELYFDDPGRLNREIDRLRAVTPDQVRDFATERLGADNRAVLTYVPESAS
jgi:predicted Zn-dependent peptidase